MSFDFISALYDEPTPLHGNTASSADRNDHDAIINEITRGCDSAVASTNAEYRRRFERNRDNLDFFREELESELRSELRDQIRRRSSDNSDNSSRRLNSNSNSNLNSNSNNFSLNNNSDSDNRSSDMAPGAAPAPASSHRDVAGSYGFEGHGAGLGLSDFVGVLSRYNQGHGSNNGGASAGGVCSNSTPNSGGDGNNNGGTEDSLALTERRRSSIGDGSTYTSVTTAPVASVAAGTSNGCTSNNRPAAAQPPSMSASALAATSAEELNIQLTRWLNEAVPFTSAASAMTSVLAHPSSAARSSGDDDDDADSSHFGSLLPNALVTSAANRAVALEALRAADPADLMRLDANLNAAVTNGWNSLPSLDAISSAISVDPVVNDPNLEGASRLLYYGIGRTGIDNGGRRFDALGWEEEHFPESMNDSVRPGGDTAIVARPAIAGTDQRMPYSNNNNNNNVTNLDNPINLPSVSLGHLARGTTDLAGLHTADSSLVRFRNQDGVSDSRSLISIRATASSWGSNTNNDSSGNNMLTLASSSATNNDGSNAITIVPSRHESTTMLSATNILRRLLSQRDSSRALPAPQRPLAGGFNQTGSGSSISESSNSDNRSCTLESSSSSSSGGDDNSNQPHGSFPSSPSSSRDNDNTHRRTDRIAQPLQFDDDIESIGTVDHDPEDLNDEVIEAGQNPDISVVANTFESTPISAVAASTPAEASTSSSASASTSHTNSATATASMTFTAATAIGNLESSTTTTIPQPQGHRVRRQAAIRGMERISTALATHGMGGSDSPVDMSNNMDRKPSANRKRSTCHGHADDSKKRPIVQADDDLNTKQPAINLQEVKAAAAKKEEDEAQATCCICLEEPTFEELASINVCKHPFCFSCIEKWADRENTCPLCKTRFVKIVRVNKPKRKRKGVDSDGAPPEKARNVKRVRQRDQRHDYSFSNPLQGIFASMEANGTWPTHIAQLLFSGLGANTMRGRDRGRATGRPFGVAAASASGTHSASTASDSMGSHRERPSMAPPPVRISTRYNRSTAGNMSSTAAESSRVGTNSSSSHAHPTMSSVLNRVSVSRHDSYEIGGGTTSSAFGAPRYSSSRSHHPSSTASATHASFDRTPWSAHASISVTYGPDGFARRTSSPSSGLSGFGGHGRPATASAASTSPRGDSSSGPVSFNMDEEEDLLSSLSPSSYIRRIHRQMERSNYATSNNSYSGHHHFSTRSSSDSSARFSQRNASTTGATASTASVLRGSSSSRRDPLAPYFLPSSFSNYLPTPIAPHVERDNRQTSALRTAAVDAAGRTAETALEIDDDSDDDDVVEVLEIAANV